MHTGEKKLGEPARIIVDDKYLKTKEMPNGVTKHFQIAPGSMCQILIANTLTTNYKHFFSNKGHTYVYWTIKKPVSQRFDNVRVLWN